MRTGGFLFLLLRPRGWMVVAFTVFLTGCHGAFSTGPTFDTSLLVPQSPAASAMPVACRLLLEADAAATEDVISRNNCVYSFLAMIDRAYYQYQASLFGAVNSANAAADIVTLGLTSAAALTPAASTKAILSVVAAGVVGSKNAINADILYNTSIELVLTQMDADRADWKSRILNQVKNDSSYNIYAAAPDLLSYYQAGTWTHAVLALQSKAGTLLANCQQNVKDTQLNTGQISAGCQPQSAPAAAPVRPPPAGASANATAATPAPQSVRPLVPAAAVVANGYSTTAIARALQSWFHDPSLTATQKLARLKAIQAAAHQDGDGDIAVGSWIDDPAQIDAQARVAKRLGIVP